MFVALGGHVAVQRRRRDGVGPLGVDRFVVDLEVEGRARLVGFDHQVHIAETDPVRVGMVPDRD
ncbi:hypothetical protein ACFQL4_21895 [Halosimplex aquaticum]